MKLINLFLALFFITSCGAHAFIVDEGWSPNLKKQIKLQCLLEDEKDLCGKLCGGKGDSCVLEEGLCRNCGGTDLYMKNLFTEMGTVYRSSGELINVDEFLTFLRAGDFISISARSVYNLADTFDSAELQMRFARLCDFQAERPVVFIEVNPISRKLGKVRYVTCTNSDLDVYDPLKTLIFRMDQEADVVSR